MDTGSLIELIGSVDAGSLAAPITSFTGIIAAVSDMIDSVITIWTTGSAEASGSIQSILGSVAGA